MFTICSCLPPDIAIPMLVRCTHGAGMLRKSDRFFFRPFLAAALLWVCCVVPLATTTIGLFPSPWLLFAALAVPAAALWCLISAAASLFARNWRRATSTIAAGILFVGGTALVVIYRTDLLVSIAVWQIKAEVALLDSARAATFKTNRGVSDGDGAPFTLVVYDATDADAPGPGPGQPMKVWTSYDWTLTGTVRGCKVKSRPLGGHFYLFTVCIDE